MKSLLLCVVASLVVCGGAAWQTQDSRGRDLAGTWYGTLGSGAVQLHLILTISRENSRDYQGQLNSKDQHALLAMEGITLKGDDVRFEVRQVGGLYLGAMTKDHDEIVGTWTQTGVPAQPLSFKREIEKPAAVENIRANSNPEDALAIVPIDVSVAESPIAFKADGRWDLAYELRIASFADVGDVAITRVELFDSNHKPIVSLSGDTLKSLIDPEGAVGLKLGPRTYTTIYMWISASSPDEIPSVLRHRVTVKESDEPSEASTETPPVPVDRKPVIVISPPLRGDNWMAANGPSDSSLHRRAILPIGGHAVIGQRFAIDWTQVYPDGAVSRGDPLNNKNYPCYGQPVYAVADGVITEVKDGIPENTPDPTRRAVEITLDTVAGNHVIEQIGDRVFATFAHLQPGSLRVKLGDHVRQGQVLGLLGNSGNSTSPHLHFQICDHNSVLACEGLPYALSSFEGEGHWKPDGPPTQDEKEIPTEGEVVKFVTAE